MPRRATKRGDERTPLGGDYDVLICGASFAGLAVARELAGSGARTLVVDRYEIGERQTSACAAPTEWLEAMGVADSIRQTFDTLVIHTPHTTVDFRLPWTFSTFDYRELCGLLLDQCDARFETAKVEGRTGTTVHTDRGDLSAPLVVDALGWKRVLAGNEYQPPDAPLSRGLEVHPHGVERRARDLDRPRLRPRRLRLELPGPRRGPDRRRLVRPALPRQGADRAARRGSRVARRSATRATGSRTSCARRPPTASSSSATRPATACR